MTRVLLIGLDGATWHLLWPWIQDGKLPTFKKLINVGVHGQLQSTVPPDTIPAWVSLGTGKNPGKFGCFSWLTKEKGSYKFTPSFLYTKEINFWDILSEKGFRVIVANVPSIHTATKINGYVVAGFLYLDERFLTYPPTLRKELDDAVGGYQVDAVDEILKTHFRDKSADPEVNVFPYIRAMPKDEYVRKINIVLERHHNAFKFLLNNMPWDFAFLAFVSPDRVQHRCWRNKHILQDCYMRIDAILKDLLQVSGQDTIVVLVSDHGFGPKKTVFNINEWLLKEGYLKLKQNKIPKLVMSLSFLRKIRLLSLLRIAVDLLGFRVPFSINKEVTFEIDSSKIDWENTKAFTCLGATAGGQIYLNVRQRDPRGVVSPEDYETLRDEIIRKLGNLNHSKRGKISARTFKREDIYRGEYLELAPDLIIMQDDNIHAFHNSVGSGEIFTEPSDEVGHHRIGGVFIASGPGIRKGIKLEGISIYDVAPTVLHIFGIDSVSDIDGRVLKEIFETEIPTNLDKKEAKYSPIEEVPMAHSSEAEKEILDRLRSLGYIDDT